MISIITTIYNGEKFILQVFSNLEKQSFKNFEWLIIDDGSNDKSREIIEKEILIKKSFKVKLLNKGKIGRAKALNLGLSNATYDYIAILDCDDLWHPKKLEFQIKFLEKADLIATGSELFTQKPTYRNFEREPDFRKLSSFNFLVFAATVSHSSIVFKKNIFQYEESLQSQLDMDLLYRFLFRDKNRCIIINYALTFHRIHENQYFEHLMGHKYQLNSLKLQFKYLMKSRFFIFIPLILLRGVYHQLPKKYRLSVRKLFKLDVFGPK